MIPPRIQTYAIPHLENKADKFLREADEAGRTVPIDVDLLFERIEGVDLDVWPGLEANHGIQGAVLRETNSGRILVCIDESLADAAHRRNRYRSTVAEELAHVLLHREVIESVTSVDDFRALQRHPDWSVAERNAKHFGHSVLMPGKILDKRASYLYGKMVGIAGFDAPETIKKYLKNELAKEFEVSPQSMEIRLGNWPLKVFEKVDEAIKSRLDYLP